MAKKNSTTKLFVLDTNVLMHDPSSIFRFEEHDIYLPMVTLEELDNNKKGVSEVARNARQTSRNLEEIIGTNEESLEKGRSLGIKGNTHVTGKLFLQTTALPHDLPMLAGSKADNQILGIVAYLKNKHPERQVILVSKDINIRIKARALGIAAEDYFNDKVLEDTEMLYTGITELPEDFWEKHSKDMESWQENGRMFYRLTGPMCPNFSINEFIFYEFDKPFHAIVRKISGKTATLEVTKDFINGKHNIWGINARNREQNFALNLLMDPDIDFVTLLGQAGTGKTLLTLAAGLAQTLDKKIYNEIIMTRVTVPVGEDIGFLPGTEEEKMTPWMGALEDNLDVLNKTDEIVFLMGNCAEWYSHPNIIHVPGFQDLQFKSNFINTCDGMVHARYIGESFGLAISEFLYFNKPVLAWNNGIDLNHINMLQGTGLLYNDQQDMQEKILNIKSFNREYKKIVDKFNPDTVMSQFKSVFLD